MTHFRPNWLVALALLCAATAAAAQEETKPAPDTKSELAVAPTSPPVPLHPARGAEKAPFELVRSMHALQDQMVAGSFAAQAALPKLSARIAERLLAAPPEVWREPKNVRAVTSYVLGGGQVRVARKVLEMRALPDADRKLLEGAVAYVEGNEARARQLLMDSDPRKLLGPLAGHLAFVQAELAPKDDVAKVQRGLDLARLLAPGTLIEEAALRREIVLVDTTANIDEFVVLAGQYERRFKNSVYADNFRQRFAASLLRLGVLSDSARFTRLDDLLANVQPDEERLNIYLLVAQAALLNGNLPVARLAAEHAAALSNTASIEGSRSTLYNGAAQILSGKYDDGLMRLKAVDLAHLPKRDAELARSVVAMASKIQGWAKAVDPADTQAAPVAQLAPERDATAAIDIAQKALADTDGLLDQ